MIHIFMLKEGFCDTLCEMMEPPHKDHTKK